MKMSATSDTIMCWSDIDFKKAQQSVKKLQNRIARAFRNDDNDKVASLQHKLIHSFYAKALSIKIVTSNKGKHTPGVDHIVWNTSDEKFKAIFDLKRRGYKPSPLRRIYIPKSNGKRPLSIPTMKDRAMQTLYKLALEPIAEWSADENSYGFRPHRSARDAVVKCIDVLSAYPTTKWIIKADIKSCFDNISHEWIMNNIPLDYYILNKFLKNGYIDETGFYKISSGIPQGGCLSCVICNMVLDGLQPLMKDLFNDSVQLIRYADDIIVIGIDSPTHLVQSVLRAIDKFLSERGLQLSSEKTNVFSMESGFTFLGYRIFNDSNKINAVPTQKNIISLTKKTYNIIKKNNDSYSVELIKSIIRGWLSYYKGIVESKLLYSIFYKEIHNINAIAWEKWMAAPFKYME